MGGQEGAKGYLMQAVVCVLESLVDLTWTSVQIEPDSDNDKIDISWHFPGDKIKVVQVKSSINSYNQSNVISWLTELIEDAKDASEFELYLIGTPNTEANKIINKINKSIDIGNAVIDPHVTNITVQVTSDSIPSFEGNIQTNIHRIINEKGYYNVDYHTLQSITKTISYQFVYFSTTGQKLSREEFEDSLFDWLRAIYKKIFSETTVINKLEISFYKSEDTSFHKEITKLQYVDLASSYQERFKELLLKFHDEISEIQINDRIVPPPQRGFATIGGQTGNLVFPTDHSFVELTSGDIKLIDDVFSENTDLTLDDSFFSFGNLTEPILRIYNVLGGYSDADLKGTDEEKLKKGRMDELIISIRAFKAYVEIFKYIGEFYIIPLVLQNKGGAHDENIKVQIKISTDVELLDVANFQVPTNVVVLEDLLDNASFTYFLKQKKDSKVEEYYNHLFVVPDPLSILTHGESEKKKQERLTDKFKDYLANIFYFQIHLDQKDYQILEFNFDSINPKENTAFPCYIFVKSKGDFTIYYEITSKSLSNKVIDDLEYVVENKTE